MKKLSLSFLILLVPTFVFAQKKMYTSLLDTSSYYSSSYNNMGFGLSVKIDEFTKRINYAIPIPNRPNDWFTFLEGSKKVTLFGFIAKDSISYYRFNVVEDDFKQIINDAIPTESGEELHNAKSNMVRLNLGTFDIDNKKLTITLVKTTNRSKIATVILYNKKLDPAQVLFLGVGGRNDKGGFVSPQPKKKSIITIDKNFKNIQFVIKNTGLDFVYYGYIKEKSTGKIVYESNNWRYDFYSPVVPHLVIDAANFQKSGDYEFIVEPKLTELGRNNFFKSDAMVYKFTIVNPNEKVISSKELALILLIVCAIGGAILGGYVAYIKKRNQKNLNDVQQQKEIAKTQLNSIRSQLNPHFMFNALACIQNLMNKNKIEEANQYLGKFARLTRNVLDQKDLVSLAEERELLTDYLQMEQLRFGFKYSIEIDKALAINNIEIPAMLLQPFVENAVKHGVVANENVGKIDITFSKNELDLILKINDNGGGFDNDKTYSGLGLQLSKNRINLLNNIYQETPLVLQIISTVEGTAISITLKQWL